MVNILMLCIFAISLLATFVTKGLASKLWCFNAGLSFGFLLNHLQL